MTSKEIYESIDQSKLSQKGREFLKSVEKNTKGFTKQNDKVDSVLKKLYADLKAKKPEALKDVTTKTVEKEVRVPTTKSERKKEPKKKTKIVKEKVKKATGKKKVTKPTKTPSTPKKGKAEHISTRASKLAKKEGISFKEARARLSKEAKEQIKKEEKQADKELDKLLKFVRKDVFEDGEKYPKIYGKQDPEKANLSADAKRMAKPVGKRVSKNGKTYYEYRDNRSDRNSLPAPKGQYKYKGKTPPFLADGGAIDSLKKDMNSKLDIHSEYYDKGGEIDLFEQYDKQPKKLSKIVEKYEERYADGDMDYKDTEKFLKEVNAIGYTFDAGLDNEPYNLRPMMAKGGTIIKKGNRVRVVNTQYDGKEGLVVSNDLQNGNYQVQIDGKVKGFPFENLMLLSRETYAKGGRTISIVNDGVKYDKSKYKAVYGDFDNDGTVNIDDANPLDKKKSGQVEQVELRKTFDKLLGVKAELDVIMYDAVETLDEKAPEGADIYARTKTPYSILKKLVEKRMLDPKRGLTDMIGTTIAVDNQKELEKVRDDIDGGLLGKVLDRDDFYKTPNAGYRAYHYIVEYKGVPVEVQLKTKNMKKLHEVSHEAYKNGTLNAKSLDSLSKTFMRADKGDAKAKAEISKLLSDKKLLASKISKGSMAKGGEILKPRNKRKGDIGNRNKKINVDTILGDRAMKMIYYDLKGNPEKEEIVSYESGVERIKFDILWLGIYDDNSTNNKTHYTFYRNDNKSLSNRKVDYQEIKMYAKGGEVKDVDWANSTDIVDVGVWFLEENYKKGNIFQSERYNISHKDLLDKLKSGKRDSKTIDQLKDMLFANGQNYSTSLYLKGYYGEDERILGEDIYYSIPDEYAKGGLTDSKYIPSYEIYEVVTKDGKVYENDYSAMEFLSGAYVSDKVVTESDEKDKNQMTLFDKGGKIPKGAIYIKRRDIDFITVGEDEDDKEKVSGKNLFNGFWIDPKKQKTLIAEAKKDGRLGKSKAKVGDKVKLIKGAGSETVFRNFPNGEYEVKKVKKGNKVVPEGFYEIENKDGNRTQLATSRFAIPMAKGGMTDGDTLGDFKKRLLELGDKEFVEYKEKQLKKQDLYYAFRDRLKNVHKQTIVIKDDLPFKKGGKIGFDGLAKKVAKRYEGKPVKSEFQNEYGKTYNKKEAMEVGRKVAGKVYRQQQSMEAGGTLPTPFGQAGLVGETGTMNEMDLFAMGGGLPQGVHQYYANTYNPAYPTPHGYAKGGRVKTYKMTNDTYENIFLSRGFKSKRGSMGLKFFEHKPSGTFITYDPRGRQTRVIIENYSDPNNSYTIYEGDTITEVLKALDNANVPRIKEGVDNDYFAKGGEIDAFIMKFVKDAPASNLRVDSQELTAKLKKGGKLGRSKHSLMQDRRRVSSESWEVAYQKRKAKMEAGGTLPTPFGQAGLVGETGTMNEMDLFAMGGGLPQGVHQYYGQTYNPAYPTPHGYAKGGIKRVIYSWLLTFLMELL